MNRHESILAFFALALFPFDLGRYSPMTDITPSHIHNTDVPMAI